MRKMLAVVTVAALASVMLGACGGDDDDSASGSKSPTSEKSSDSTKAGGDDGTTVSTTGNDEYDELLKKAQNASYRVTYTSSGSNDEFTISHDPPNSAFIAGDSRYVKSGDTTIACSGSGSDEQCFSMPGGSQGVDAIVQGFFGAYASLFLANGESNPFFDVKSSDDETIAGRDAKCASVDASKLAGSEGHVKVCIDKETGILLLGETEGGGDKSTIEATEVGDPQDSDFDVPDNVTDLSSLPGADQ
jgi:hypothetical protein